jgi:hypothetical protein
MSGDSQHRFCTRVAAALVMVAAVGVVAWNAAAGLRVTDRHARGSFVEDSRAAQRVTDCFNRVVVAKVPAGARVHLDIADPSFEQRLTEGPYPHALVVPPDEPADFVIQVELGATDKFPPCAGYTVKVTSTGGGG